MKWGEAVPAEHDLSSLRILGSVGEPINPEAWIWYRRVIGGDRTPVVDTWWQTETGAIMISPLPGVTDLKPGAAQHALPGIQAQVWDESGKEVGPGGGGYLVINEPWPAMLRGIWGDEERYKETYWSQYDGRSEEHTSELQSRGHLVCRLLLEKKKQNNIHSEMTTLVLQSKVV